MTIDDVTIAWCAYCRKQTLIEAGEPLPLCSICTRDQEQLTPHELEARLLAEQAEAIAHALPAPAPAPAARARVSRGGTARQKWERGNLWFGKSDAAVLLGINRSETLERLIREGKIRTKLWQGKVMIAREEIQRILDGGDDALRAMVEQAEADSKGATESTPVKKMKKSAAVNGGDPLDNWKPSAR